MRWSLDASPDINVDYRWFPTRLRSNWPVSIGNVLDSDRYDVIVIGDLDSDALSKEQWQKLAQRVDRGLGLLLLGGYHAFGPGGYQKTSLADVMPVEMDQFARQQLINQNNRAGIGPVRFQPVQRGTIR